MSLLDPITLAVIHNGLQQVCNEMDLAFVRAAFSPVISEALDRSDGIYHATTGELVAQGELGLPVFVGTMQFGTQAVIERARDLAPGDLYIVNDPYLGGTHLMDVRFVKPYFYRGELFAWLANTGHWPDTGGMVPGGFSANATEVEQEGLRLPPVKLFKRGAMDEEILSIILSNIRIADQRIGDIKAQAAALAVGERRLTALVDRYGRDTVRTGIEELKVRAEQQMRARIATIPDGRYHGRAWVDSDGVVDEPLTIDMRIEKSGTDLHFDMSGSSPPCAGPMNSVIATTRSSIYLAMKHIFPEVPINAGTFAPLHIADPDGTFLYARYPRPVSGCAAEVSQRIAEAVFNALTPAIPASSSARPPAPAAISRSAAHDPQRDRAYVMYVISGGGYGGSPVGDGISNGCSTIGISKSTPVEVFEQLYPVAVRGVRAARRIGRCGRTTRRVRAALPRAPAARDRQGVVRDGPRPHRVPSARSAARTAVWNVVIVTRGGVPYHPPHRSKDQGIVLQPGDTVEVRTPAAADTARSSIGRRTGSRETSRSGYYTPAQAYERFQVCLSPETGEVDYPARPPCASSCAQAARIARRPLPCTGTAATESTGGDFGLSGNNPET